MISIELDNVTIQSCNCSKTPQMFLLTFPCGLLGIFGHSRNCVHVIATINYRIRSSLCFGCSCNTFNVI